MQKMEWQTVDPHQAGAVPSRSILFAQACLSKTLRPLRYTQSLINLLRPRKEMCVSYKVCLLIVFIVIFKIVTNHLLHISTGLISRGIRWSSTFLSLL